MTAPIFVPDEIVTAAKMNSLPKGYIGHVAKLTDQASIGAAMTDVSGLTVTFTAEASRYYKVTVLARASQQSAGGLQQIALTDGSNNQLVSTQVSVASAGLSATHTPWIIHTPAAGSFTYKVRANTSGGTMTVSGVATYPALILVEDVGGV